MKNLNVENLNVNAIGYSPNSAYIGGVIAYAANGYIDGIQVTGTNRIEDASTSGTSKFLGGILGYSYKSRLDNCYVEAEIVTNDKNANGYIGGIVGEVVGSLNLQANSSNVNITDNYIGTSYVGGIIGLAQGETSGGAALGQSLLKCHSNVSISSSDSSKVYAGGLVGYAGRYLVVKESYSIGNIKVGSQNSDVGGLVGYAYGTTWTSSATTYTSYIMISDAYSNVMIEGEATSESNIAGLIGNSDYSKISNVYAIGKIQVSNGNIGGIIGSPYSTLNVTIKAAYWSPETVGIKVSDSTLAGDTRLFKEMLYKENYTDWDFDTIWGIEDDCKSLPYLLNNGESKILSEDVQHHEYVGNGKINDPFCLYTIEDLQSLASTSSYNYFKIMNDIDASDFGNFEPIGIDEMGFEFNGELNGDGHIISNLYIESTKQYVGLFGCINVWAKVKNIKLSYANISSSFEGDSYIGGIVGANYGSLDNVTVDGDIKNFGVATNLYMGQIAGVNTGIINRAHSDGVIQNSKIVRTAYIGGIVGSNRGNRNNKIII